MAVMCSGGILSKQAAAKEGLVVFSKERGVEVGTCWGLVEDMGAGVGATSTGAFVTGSGVGTKDGRSLVMPSGPGLGLGWRGAALGESGAVVGVGQFGILEEAMGAGVGG